MHEKFIEEIKKLTGKAIKSIGVGENESHMLFQLHVGDELLCFEVAKPDPKCWGGRCFIMKDYAVDGAGVFPLAGAGK